MRKKTHTGYQVTLWRLLALVTLTSLVLAVTIGSREYTGGNMLTRRTLFYLSILGFTGAVYLVFRGGRIMDQITGYSKEWDSIYDRYEQLEQLVEQKRSETSEPNEEVDRD